MKYILIIASLLVWQNVFAQKKIWVSDANQIVNFQFQYTRIMPDRDFAKRFSNFNGIGFGVMLKTKHNLAFSGEGNYHFSSTIKPNSYLANLTNNVSAISNSAGYPSSVSLGMRGFNIGGKIGYLLSLSHKNRNSGLVFLVGGSLVMHKVHIATTRNEVPGLTPEKKAGYDRYSSGWAISQFVGYQFQSINRSYNFYIGFDLMQAYTYNRRKFNYDERQFDTGLHRDDYYGIKVGWMIPIYLNTKTNDDEFIFK